MVVNSSGFQAIGRGARAIGGSDRKGQQSTEVGSRIDDLVEAANFGTSQKSRQVKRAEKPSFLAL